MIPRALWDPRGPPWDPREPLQASEDPMALEDARGPHGTLIDELFGWSAFMAEGGCIAYAAQKAIETAKNGECSFCYNSRHF